MSKIKIGWSEVSIVPEGRKIDLVGQFAERISDQVETPISVTALAMECGNDCMVFVSCDLLMIPYDFLQTVRDRLPETCNFPKDKLIIGAIHTHTSMGYKGLYDSFENPLECLNRMKPDHIQYVSLAHDDSKDVLRDEEALEFLVEKIVKAIEEAWTSRAEGSYATGFGRAAVGMCRRVCYDDGSAKMWGDTNMANFAELETGNDSGIELMFTYDANKKLTGVIANVSCPSQVLEHQVFISSDYMGKLRGKIQDKFGKEVCLLGMIAPAGDQCPRDMIRWVDSPICKNDPNISRDHVIPRKADPSMFDIQGCEKVARRIFTEILYELEDVTEYVTDTEMKHKTLTVDIPLRRVTIQEKEAAEKEIKDFFAKCDGFINFEDNARMQIHSGTIARYELQQTMDVYDIEVHVLRIGDVAFATNPYELFLNYGNQIRARSLAKQTFLSQLTCGAMGYLPTEKAEKGSHYSAFVGSGTTGHQGGDILVRKTLKEINEMFADAE